MRKKQCALLLLAAGLSLWSGSAAPAGEEPAAEVELEEGPEGEPGDADFSDFSAIPGEEEPDDFSVSEEALSDEKTPAAESSGKKEKKKENEDADDLDGLIEDPGGNNVDESVTFEVTDEWGKAEIAKDEAAAGPVYGKLYPPAPLLEGINSFRQGDMRWGTHPYGFADAAGTVPATISSSGCGLMSLVNAVYYMTGNFIDPAALADWSTARGFRLNGTGTVHSLYQAFADAHGKEYGFTFAGTASSLAQIRTFLHEEGTAVISTDHHLMCVADYDSGRGGYLLLDSAPSAYRGTSPTGYRYLSEADFAESIPVYAIMMLKPVRQEKKEIPFNALSGPDEESSAALSKGTQAFFDYIYDCYLITERLDVLAPQSAARQEH